MRYIEQSNSEAWEAEGWLPGAGGAGKGELLSKKFRVSLRDDGKILEMVVVMVVQQDKCT